MQENSFHSAWIAADGSSGSAGAAASLFPWWSLSKTALSICALRLVEDGRLRLDTPLPHTSFTLRQLLQHRAGVPNYGGLASYHEAVAGHEAPWSREHLLDMLGGDRLDFPPGTGWSYSNVGYMIVREAIEDCTSLDLAEALQDGVLRLLQIPSVRLATNVTDFAEMFWPDVRTYDPGWVYHGCLIGNPADAAKLLHALFQRQILREETLRTMLARHDLSGALPGRPWTECGYGLGLMSGRMGAAGRAIGHSGGGPHCVNAVYHFPDLDVPMTVATFTNGENEGAAEFEAVRIALES